jgi:hypothetical protein
MSDFFSRDPFGISLKDEKQQFFCIWLKRPGLVV